MNEKGEREWKKGKENDKNKARLMKTTNKNKKQSNKKKKSAGKA